ncbi:TnsA endonuclease N terminal [Tsukamurella pulmonis]|uniref:TnsA endonuclease N terminal n=1 Tax=Tsukamurella pulmonis TaxID=47312 RepID=A0A1H1F4W2_9ACTN|nr:TnsA-like heteromeric transposase endonuclease subunit [Tsukamurella pulmonis]SDQ95928.1 TnsA endonuclease N terminal [Tsukamurella pulmonis]SUP20088.1 TnsA endonuclease N terminal [Tsukamurella pulmonis]
MQAPQPLAARDDRLPAAVSGSVTVTYMSIAGVVQRDSLAVFAAMDAVNLLSVRKPRSFKGQRNFTGEWWSSTMGDHVVFESWVERDWLMLFDQNPDVIEIVSQPLTLELSVGGRTRSHTPDVLVRRRDGSTAVVDVRPDGRVDEDAAAVFAATRDCCVDVGWDYLRLGVLDVVHAANLRWLAGYRQPRCRDDSLAAAALTESTNGPLPIGVLADRVGPQIAVLPTLFHLIWTGELSAPLARQILGLETVVAAAAGGGGS